MYSTTYLLVEYVKALDWKKRSVSSGKATRGDSLTVSDEATMSSWFKQIFPFMKVKKKKEFSYIIRGVDPLNIWELVGELGDGSFGKVYKVSRFICQITLIR